MVKQFVEFKGWVSINNNRDEGSYDDLKKVIIQLNAFIDSLGLKHQLCEIRSIGLMDILLIGGVYNHDNGYSDALLSLLNKVAELTPLSYGLVYVRRPEDEFAWNDFKVYKVARGSVTIENDPFLSPCNPIIES